MAQVFLGVGSNIEREHYIGAGLDALQHLFGEFSHSSVYDSAAIGFDGQPFLNLVVGVETHLEIGELARQLRQVEFEHGRLENASRFSSRRLDIDVLTYDDRVGEEAGITLPRAEILQNAFVLQPLAELAPAHLHPVVGQSYGELWRGFDKSKQQLQRIEFCWRGRQLSGGCDVA
ncbi:MAG: 2-amino-4-hydroxy-6-hydroxymethyldihydropteridine diphosphokinase [Halieaceae bacterium]|jgi:2-amino-4-hydroxy-6-hydroxymethyldihydropteridine diphosphokinase|nr:2-amino-4-hydroxy-6-hydroxymethyldihydropteridine diphosphokinase [Halieaceae bacterium]